MEVLVHTSLILPLPHYCRSLKEGKIISQEVVVKVAPLWEDLAGRWLAIHNAMRRGRAGVICRAGPLAREGAPAPSTALLAATREVHMLTAAIWLFKICLKNYNQNKMNNNDNIFI